MTNAALEVRNLPVPADPPPATLALVRPVVKPAAMIEAHKEAAALIAEALESGRDYGVIPGTGDKPTLLKPGAERLAAAYGCRLHYSVVQSEVDHDRETTWTKRKKVWRNEHKGDRRFDWKEESGVAHGLYRYVVRCELVRRDTGEVMGDGLGTCSTMEGKYCDRPRECENTVLKMAEKRALVAAVLNAFALSDRFTQDVEDQAPRADAQASPAPRRAGKKAIGDRTDTELQALYEWCLKHAEDPRGEQTLAKVKAEAVLRGLTLVDPPAPPEPAPGDLTTEESLALDQELGEEEEPADG